MREVDAEGVNFTRTPIDESGFWAGFPAVRHLAPYML
jgi:hypothetical protein